MGRRRSWAWLVAGVAAGVLALYLVQWAQVSRFDEGRSDFASADVGGLLLRQGQGRSLYEEDLQRPLHASLLAPGDREGNLEFVDAPPAALVTAPFTTLDLPTAYRLFSLLQLLLVVAAVAIAAWAAPWPAAVPRTARVAVAAAGAAGGGTYALLLQGQWAGFFALGLALGYADLRRGNQVRGAIWLFLPLLAVKPNLAVGLALLLLGARQRRALVGLGVTAVGVALTSIAVAGLGGSVEFIRAAQRTSHLWPMASMSSAPGIVGSWFGEGRAATALGIAACGVAALACLPLGRAWAGSRSRLEPALAAAALLGLLASPHLYVHDLAPLAPVLVLLTAWVSSAETSAGGAATPWPGRWTVRLLAAWAVTTCVVLVELNATVTGFPGRLVPWCLLGLLGLCVVALRGSMRPAVGRSRELAPAAG